MSFGQSVFSVKGTKFWNDLPVGLKLDCNINVLVVKWFKYKAAVFTQNFTISLFDRSAIAFALQQYLVKNYNV